MLAVRHGDSVLSKKYWPKSDDHQNDDIAAPGVTEVVLRLP